MRYTSKSETDAYIKEYKKSIVLEKWMSTLEDENKEKNTKNKSTPYGIYIFFVKF